MTWCVNKPVVVVTTRLDLVSALLPRVSMCTYSDACVGLPNDTCAVGSSNFLLLWLLLQKHERSANKSKSTQSKAVLNHPIMYQLVARPSLVWSGLLQVRRCHILETCYRTSQSLQQCLIDEIGTTSSCKLQIYVLACAVVVVVTASCCGSYLQERSANNVMATLSKMMPSRCIVVRDGIETQVDAAVLVPGDLVLLKLGDRVPADIRIISSSDLKASWYPCVTLSICIPFCVCRSVAETNRDMSV